MVAPAVREVHDDALRPKRCGEVVEVVLAATGEHAPYLGLDRRRDVELEGRGAVINAASGMLGTVSRSLLRRSLGHCIVYRNGATLEVDPVESELGFEHAVDAVLGTTLPLDAQRDARDFVEVQRSHGISKLVLVTDTVHEPLFEEVAALCELTVIFLGTEGGLSVDDSDGYTLIRLSTEALASRVKSLEV